MKKYILLILAFLLSFNSYAQTTNGGVRFVGNTVVMQLDDDARNIIRTIENERVAGGGAVFTLAERTYVNYIVTNFKAIGVWSKITALYGFVGGTAASHKWNWKDLRNLDAAYRLVFPNGMTHSANGIQGNGSTQYANTFLNPSTTLSLNSVHLSCFINQGSFQQAFEIGASTSTSNIIALITSWTDSKIYGAINTNSYTISNNTFLPTGYTLVNAISSPIKLFKNGNIVQSNILSPSTTLTTNSIFLLALNSGITISQYSSKRMSFASIGSGLTDTEAIRMSNIVTFAQGILNRQ